jgi:hypothetical protein
MFVAGIDYSMTSPAICFYDTDSEQFNYDTCVFHYLTQSKKYEVEFGNVYGHYFEYDSEMKRYDTISSFFIDKILDRNVEHVFIEDYSMGSKGRVFHIAENTGILKYRLWLVGVKFTCVPPTVIKKFATGKGNSDKQKMQDFFETENNVRFKQELNMTEKQWNPSSDLIDSYYICKYGVTALTNAI